MQYSNEHLLEVSCGFNFPQETTQWESTFFGSFSEKIKPLGFDKREERKGVQFTLGIENNQPITPTTTVDDQVIFKNDKGWAILMSKNKISFHILKNYSNWNDFIKVVIQPFSEIYKSLGLGNGIRECQIVYLNRFEISNEKELSDYFTTVPQYNKDLGDDVATNVQRVVKNGDNLLITKFNSQLVNNTYNINLECGAISTDISDKNGSDWIKQANNIHTPINNFFEKIITDNLRILIK